MELLRGRCGRSSLSDCVWKNEIARRAACGGRVWYLWVNDLAPRDTYLPISMMFSTGQTIPYLPRRGEHHPNPSAHNPVTIGLVRYELNTFYLKSNPGSRSSEVRKMHRSWGPLWRVSRRAPLRAPRWAAWRMSRWRPPQRPHQNLVVALLLSQNLVVARARAGTFYGVIVDCK